MDSTIRKLTLLGTAVLLILAVAPSAHAGDAEPAGVVRLARLGSGAAEPAVEQTSATYTPAAPCSTGACATGTCGTAASCCDEPCAPKKSCCLSCGCLSGGRLSSGCLSKCCLLGCCSDDNECPECENECDDGGCCCCRMLGFSGHGDGPYDAWGYHPYGSAAEMRLACWRRKFGYFIPSGDCGQGLPWAGHYGLVYPLNPEYFDPRDGRIYAAQGYGTPIATPLAPNVDFTYNYGWGIPSSRLTPVSRHVPNTVPITWPIPAGQRY